MSNEQLLLAIGIPTLAVLIGILLNSSSNKNLRDDIKDVRADVQSTRDEMNGRFGLIENRVAAFENRVETRFTTLEIAAMKRLAVSKIQERSA